MFLAGGFLFAASPVAFSEQIITRVYVRCWPAVTQLAVETCRRYIIQWSSDDSFGSGSGESRLSAPSSNDLNGSQWMAYTIEGWKKRESAEVDLPVCIEETSMMEQS